MMKKGTMQTLIGLVLAFFALVILHNTVYANVIKPILFDNTRSVSYDSFVIMTSSIQGLVDRDSQTAIGTIVFDIEPGFTILAFNQESGYRYCGDIIISKPNQCEHKEPCICLFKGELKDERKDKVKNNDNDKLIVGECFKPEVEGSRISQRVRMYSRYYVDEKDYLYPTCEDASSNTYTINNLKYKSVSIQGTKNNFGTVQLFIYLRNKDYGGTIGTDTNVFIDVLNDESKLRYKLDNTCPTQDSDDECRGGKHYDQVVQDPNDNEKKLVCKFIESDNICTAEPIEECPSDRENGGLIKEECACGDIAYNSGYCIINQYKINDVPADLCFEEHIATCEDYGEDKDEREFESRDMACLYNECELQTPCLPYYNNNVFSHGLDSCGECPAQGTAECNCARYVDLIRPLDPCGCCDSIADDPAYCDTLKVNSCGDYEKGNYPIEEKIDVCLNNICKSEVRDNCRPYENWLGDIKCEKCPRNCDCDDYMNDEIRAADPCRCGC